MIRAPSLVVVLLVSFAAAAQEDLATEMRALAKASYARDSSYEMEAVKAFLGATGKCAPPPGAPAPEPFEIFVEVLPDGALGRAVFVPLTKAAQCVKAETATVTFPKPPFKYVAHIRLKFDR
jgi:hypothetical protein